MGLLALLGVAGIVGGAVAGYRTYDYVEHDNEFCLSCHLMVEPYELFAESAHRGLGCKACHKPTFQARSEMALTQILENPDEIHTHAEVTNDKCASCHIEGDPERWESIRNSAGHRIHLESDDPSLEGLNCVECHSSSLHQFTAASETCAQSGCHTDSGIQLGGMSDLTIHCVACHGFSEPTPGEQPMEALMAATRPDAESCLSCHQMRVLVDLPDDEPHDAACGVCHNPHEQTTPAEAVESCATAGCHSQPDTLTPFHRGLSTGVLSDCSACHEAHEWRVDGENCLACHQDIVDQGAGAGGAGAVAARAIDHRGAPATRATGRSAGPTRTATVGSMEFRLAGLLHGPPTAVRAAPTAAPPAPAQLSDSVFTHRQHRSVDCMACHSTELTHGRVTVTSINDCRSCHHTGPVAEDCSTCHTPADRPDELYNLTRTMQFAVRDPVRRELPFEHAPHETIDCARCHTEGLARSAAQVDCASCHEDHHRPDVECRSCHVEAPAGAHPLEVHQTCSGSGCHTDVPAALANIPGTRAFCLTCHQDLVDHRPGGTCRACHQLPEARPSGGAGEAS